MNSPRPWIPILLTLGVLAFVASPSLAEAITDGIWFDAIGHWQVFSTLLLTRGALGLVFGLVTFGILFGHVRTALSMRREPGPKLARDMPDNPLAAWIDELSGDRVAFVGSATVAVVVGMIASSWWQAALLFWYGGDFARLDPVLGNDAGFYVFTLPLIQIVRGTLSQVWLLSTMVVVVLYMARDGIVADVTEYNGTVYWRSLHVREQVKRHLAVLLVGLGVFWGGAALIDRWTLLYDQTGLFAGPGYTAVGTLLPLKLVEAAAWLASGLLAAVAVRRMDVRLGSGSVVLGVVTWVMVLVVPSSVQRVMVVPNELAYESEFIQAHIEATRFGFGLGEVEEMALPGDDTLTRAEIDANQSTLKNVRLWDHEPLLATFGQVQEIRTYYKFFQVDNDRYIIDGELRQVMMSPRELESSALPKQAQTWVNKRMVYTHGYGVALGPVNEVTEQGLPTLFVKDLPPKIAYPSDLRIDRPEIYYGEGDSQAVFVNTNVEEFDYPTGDANVYTKYAGKGGAPIGSFGTRALFAWREGEFKLLLTTDLTPDSRVLMHRQVGKRVQRVAPWAAWDSDPYLVITEGRLVWLLDGYTVSGRFPYSVRAKAKGPLRGANYVRSSVKATVDAYDGTVTLYAMDDADPVLQAWKLAFPDLLTPAAELSADLRAHLRFPQDFFSVQTDLFATYHMTEPQVFYNREDEWAVPRVNEPVDPDAKEPADGNAKKKPKSNPMTPYYTVMRLPGQAKEEFVVMLPFVPSGKQNLAAWMVGRNDGEHFGELQAWKFPKDKLIYGPEMVVGRINQDDLISEKLSLWGQTGSKADLGTLLVIPIDESLLYVQPLYLSADSGSVPELKRVIVAYGDDIVMARTLDEAVDLIFGPSGVAEAPVLPASDGETPPVSPPAVPVVTSGLGADAKELTNEAIGRYRAAVEAQRSGDWAAYGVELEALGVVLERLDTLDEQRDEGSAEPTE